MCLSWGSTLHSADIFICKPLVADSTNAPSCSCLKWAAPFTLRASPQNCCKCTCTNRIAEKRKRKKRSVVMWQDSNFSHQSRYHRVCLCAVIDSWAPLSRLDVTVWLTMQQGKPGPYIPIGQQMGVKEGLALCYNPLTQNSVCEFLYLYSCLCIYYVHTVVLKHRN